MSEDQTEHADEEEIQVVPPVPSPVKTVGESTQNVPTDDPSCAARITTCSDEKNESLEKRLSMSAVHVHSTRLPRVGRSFIPSTLRRILRSLSEIPSTLRRNLRSIAMSFFLPCEHNNRKADRIAFLNNKTRE